MSKEIDVFSWREVGALEATMTASQKTDLKKEQQVWHSVIKPFLLKVTDARKITDATAEDDRDYCIDAWVNYCGSDDAMPIARRIQWIDDVKTYETFTIRCARRSGNPTEYEKLTEALEWGPKNPLSHVQIYVNDKNEIRLGIVSTRKLFEFIKNHEQDGLVRVRENYDGSSAFLIVNWCDLEYDGIRVTVLSDLRGV